MSLARNVATVGTATLLSRLLGFFRDVGIAAVLGAGVFSDAFFAALQIPNLFRRLLAEGALNAAFVPMWQRARGESGEPGARRFGEDVLGTMVMALGATALLCIVFAPAVVQALMPGFRVGGERFTHAVLYVRLSTAYVVIAGVVAVAASRLNAEGRVAAPAFGLIIFNGVMLVAVGAVLLSGLVASPRAGAILSAAVVIAGLCQAVLVGAALLRVREPPLVPRIRWSAGMRRFYARMLPGAIAAGVPQLKLIAGAMVASSSASSVSWLYYANRLYELPLGLVSVSVAAVVVPLVAASVSAGRREAIAAAQSRALELAVGLALPAAVALALLADPIAGALFERGTFGPRDTAAVAAALAALAVGLPGHALERVFGAISFAHEDTRTPMAVALGGLAVAVLGSVALFPIHSHVGVAAAIAMSGWVGAGALGIVLASRGWLAFDGGVRRRLPRLAAAAGVMGLIVAAIDAWLATRLGITGSALGRAAALAILVAIGLAAYLALLAALDVLKPREIMTAIRARL